MGARRSTVASDENSGWRRTHRALLAECGVPDAVADSDRRWVYVLLHGDDYSDTGWDASWISPGHAASLLDRLLADFPSPSGYELIQCLQHRASTRDA